ncbi:MAG: peptidoglycan DD-metalloendopeptidase family protein [Oscillospiraceae bacterium]|nr:peptidoglycan DD-metalloendopeptidase family protein [Oscillospiraceae bacterium]
MMRSLEFIEELGSEIRFMFVKVFGALFLVLSFPFRQLLRLFLAVYIRLKRTAKSSFKRVVGDERFFTGRILRAFKGIFFALKNNPKSVPGVIKYYAVRSSERYGGLVRYLILIIMPVGAATILALTLLHYASLSPALKLSVNGELLGYVSSENDYISARADAAERLSLGTDGETDISAILPEVSISPELISINKFTGENALSEKLIEMSSAQITSACGISIDGEFLCAVRNETDARRVFDTILSENSDSDGSGIVSFLEDIRYVQGLYPDTDAVIWDAAELMELLESAKSNDVYYTVSEGETSSDVAEKFGLTPSRFNELNPKYSGEDEIPEGENLLVYKAKDFLTVKTVKTEVENVTIDFETVEIPTDLLYIGARRTVVNGEKGVQQVTKIVTYVGGEKTGEEEVSRITLKEPGAERIQVGTRALDSSYVATGNYGGLLLWPAVGANRINSDYAYRWGKMHRALDIGSYSGSSLGKTVVAAAQGTVVVAGVHSSYGYYVKIDHGRGMQTLYAHCMAGSLMVKVGDKVYEGQPIAKVGQTGYATGPHLHFEVIINGVRVDPKPYLGIK